MANEYTLGQKLQGIGAALSGTVPQFQQQMLQLDQARTKAMYQDAGAAYKMLQDKNYDGIIDLADDRLRILNRLPGSDTSDTENIKRLTQQAKAGSNQAYLQLVETLGSAYNTGLSRGLTNPLPVNKYLGTEDGIVLMQTPSGEIKKMDLFAEDGSAEGSGGGQSYAQRMAWQELRKDFRNDANALNQKAATVLDEYGKVGGLINQASDEKADIRSRRQAAATLVTVLARMASPGVVTDRDFSNFSGGLSLLDYAKSEVASGGNFQLFRDYMEGKGLDDTILAAIDPLNPDTFSKEGMLALANNLVMPAGESILAQYADQMYSASQYNPRKFEMDATFKPNSPNIRKLGEISMPGFNMKDYYSDPQNYITELSQQQGQQQEQQQVQEGAITLADIPQDTSIYGNRDQAVAAAENMRIGDVVYFLENRQLRSEVLE